MDIERESLRRMMVLYGMSDDSPMPPVVFHDQLAPAWARVWNEVASEHKESDLPWKDRRVLDQFVRLAGFNPREFEYAPDLRQQQAALRRGREIVQALYLADEVEQLDGMPALDYGHGWMCALYFIASLPSCDGSIQGACDRSLCPPDELIERARSTSESLYHPTDREDFGKGFRACVATKANPENCLLRCKP